MKAKYKSIWNQRIFERESQQKIYMNKIQSEVQSSHHFHSTFGSHVTVAVRSFVSSKYLPMFILALKHRDGIVVFFLRYQA